MSMFAQTLDNDLVITNGSLVLVEDPAEAAAIKLGNKFRSSLGEYFLDTRIGVPYLQMVFVKNPDLNLIGQLFRRVILGTAPIVDVLDLQLDLDNSTRNLDFSFRALTDEGAIITGGSGVPFIVEVKPS